MIGSVFGFFIIMGHFLQERNIFFIVLKEAVICSLSFMYLPRFQTVIFIIFVPVTITGLIIIIIEFVLEVIQLHDVIKIDLTV